MSSLNSKDKKNVGGVEDDLNSVANLYFIGSVIGLIACIVVSQSNPIKESGNTWIWIFYGVVILGQGVIFRTLLKAGAEVVRLLKKLNGLPYSGEITKPEEEIFEEQNVYTCPDCKSEVAADAKECPKCGVKFDE